MTNTIPSTLNQLQSDISALMSNQPNTSNLATRDNINQLQQTFLILWGLMPCPPEAGPICTSAKFIRDLATQASVDGLAGGVGALQTSVNSRASQSSVDSLAGQVSALPRDWPTCSRRASRTRG